MIRKALLALFFISLFASFAAGTSHAPDTETVDTVILASTENYPDALVAGSAAAKIGAPVLLTHKGELTERTQRALDHMSPSEVILVGGEEVIAADVRTTLESDGYTVTRLWGNTRYGTSVEVAEHFWVEGTDEALLVQNSLDDTRGDVLAEAKELAREEAQPVYLTPEDDVPAVVLSSLENLDVRSVTIVGTDVSSTYRSSLRDIGVSIDEEITGEQEEDVERKIRERVKQRIDPSERMLVLASGHFRHHIAGSNMPNHHVAHVRDENGIQDVVDTVNDRGVEHVTVGGTPDLAEDAAEALREQTDAEVRLVVAESDDDAVEVNANITADERRAFAEEHRERMQEWEDRRQQHRERVKERVNETINEADRLVDENASEEAQRQLRRAKLLYSKGDYFEAMEAANEARSEARRDRWKDRMDERREAMREAMEEEMESLQERTDELREVNREFADEMEENMTTEERLEVIEEFRHERRETIEELTKEAQETDAEIQERLHERLRDARNRLRDRTSSERFRFEAECTDESADEPAVTESEIAGHHGAVSASGDLLLPTPNYVAEARSEKTGDNTLDVTVTVRETQDIGVECVGAAEYKYRVETAPGNWTVNVGVTVDGSTVHTDTRTVTVEQDDDMHTDPGKVACQAEIERAQAAAEMEDACAMAAEELECPHDDDVTYTARNSCEISHLKDQGWTSTTDDDSGHELPTNLTLESTDYDFYYNGEAVDEVSVPAGESVTVTFHAREEDTYSAGVEYHSPHFTTDAVAPGGRTTVDFTAREDFTIDSYWPEEDVYKTSVDVNVE